MDQDGLTDCRRRPAPGSALYRSVVGQVKTRDGADARHRRTTANARHCAYDARGSCQHFVR